MTTSWAWRVHLDFIWTSPAGRVCKEDEFNKTAPAPQAPAAPAPAAGKNGARAADELPTPPAGEGAKAGACNPAPGEGAVQRPAAA